MTDAAAYVDRETGEILWCGEGVDQPLPKDIDDFTRYVEQALREWCVDNGFAAVSAPRKG